MSTVENDDAGDDSACRMESTAAAGGRRSLDKRTQLDGCHRWRATVYPTAGEACISLITTPRERSSEPSPLSDEERARCNHERANRRAIGEARRYMVHNRLRYQWVLTFADGRHDADGRAETLQLVGRFVVRLRAEVGRMPYLYSPELHPGGHGWHTNFYVPRRLPHAMVERLWGHGIVWVSDYLKHPLVKAAKLSPVEAVRLAAVYACKYASKDWSREMLPPGARRFCTAEGCKPTKRTIPHSTLARALDSAKDEFNGAPADHEWSSSESKTWDGPPVHILRWRRAAEDYSGG
jgi:hypothetical protein